MLYPVLMNVSAFIFSLGGIIAIALLVTLLVLALLPLLARRQRQLEGYRQKQIRLAQYEAEGKTPHEQWMEEEKRRGDDWERRLRNR